MRRPGRRVGRLRGAQPFPGRSARAWRARAPSGAAARQACRIPAVRIPCEGPPSRCRHFGAGHSGARRNSALRRAFLWLGGGGFDAPRVADDVDERRDLIAAPSGGARGDVDRPGELAGLHQSVDGGAADPAAPTHFGHGEQRNFLWHRIDSEPPRLSRRPHLVRRGSCYGKTFDTLSGGGSRTGCPAGFRASGRAWLAMGGDVFDRGEVRLHDRDAAAVGPSG